VTPSPDTIVAIATAPGHGGIGVVRLSGSAVPAIAAALVAKPLPPRTATLATFRDARAEPLDQGLALHFPAPNSYTGEHVLELHGHGGPAVLRLVLGRCVELGARLAEPGEFTQRAFLNGKLDLAQAEGVADLIEAATATAARAAVRSLSGAFSAAIDALVAALIELRTLTEATLDFPDEDIDFLRAADARGRLAAIQARLAGVLAQARAGALLRDGLAVVLVGEPNVGKSSLLNRLAGEEAAIVTPIPGTTRDAIERQIEIGGIPLTIVDTAGLRPTDDPIETIGIERTWAAVRRADLALVLVDARAPDGALGATAEAILAQLPEALPRVLVHNKIDLTGAAARVERSGGAGSAASAPRGPSVWLSAKSGVGVEALRQEILTLAGAHADMEGSFLARERHLVALREAAAHVEAAAGHLDQGAPPLELFAEELREAQQALATITGEFTADDLLGAIFSRFCIGK
jgi:tRNA modification GTPase